MRIIKKIVSGILVLSILLTPGINAFAATDSSDEVISFEEYYSTLRDEYFEYGITYEVYQKNDDFVYTKNLLEAQLVKARQEGIELIKQQQEIEKQSAVILAELKKSIEIEDRNIVTPMVMYITRNFSSIQTVTSPSGMGRADICLEAEATADADKGYFLWINSYDNYQSGYYVNFKSWDVTYEKCTVESFHGTRNAVFYEVEGRLTIEYTEPKTGLLVGYTSSHSLPIMWFY